MKRSIGRTRNARSPLTGQPLRRTAGNLCSPRSFAGAQNARIGEFPSPESLRTFRVFILFCVFASGTPLSSLVRRKLQRRTRRRGSKISPALRSTLSRAVIQSFLYRRAATDHRSAYAPNEIFCADSKASNSDAARRIIRLKNA